MRVLIFTQYFTPEIGATQTRLHTFAAGLAERGHHVEVVCEIPNHPQGVVHEGYGGRLVDRRELDGFRVNYVWVRTSVQKTPRSRLAFYGSYAAAATVVGSALKRPDVIFASSPPLPVAAAAAAVAARHRVPWVMDVRDLWPQAAVAMGELRNERLVRAVERLAQWLYRNAALVTVVTLPFKEALTSEIGDGQKVMVLPNGTTRFWVDAATLEPTRESLDLPDDEFLWTFAGNVGKAQGLDAAVAAAGILGHGFRLVVLGNGPARSALEARAKVVTPRSVIFRDQVRPELAARYLRASDALLVSLAADEALAGFVPSKLYDCCAVGRPVIVASGGEAARLAGHGGAALTVAPGHPGLLADAVRRLRDDEALRKRLAAAGRSFGRQSLREHQLEALEAALAGVARGGRARRFR